jgi:hypothetical protein
MILNASQIAADIRSSLNEASASHWTDLEILRKMNKAQTKLAMLLSMTIGDWLLTRATITPVDSLVTLPSDCAKPVYMEDVANGVEIQFSTTVRERNFSRISATGLDQVNPNAYMYGNYIEINQASYTNQVYLWYERNIPDLHFGTGGTNSGSNVLVFQVTNIPAPRDDYYNGNYVSVTAGTGVGTRAVISDYTGSTGAATVTGTFSTDSIYGTETILPEQAIIPLTQLATVELLAKPSSAIDPKYFEYAKLESKDSLSVFTDWISTRVKNSQRVRNQEEWA